jgi:hypothetical protein
VPIAVDRIDTMKTAATTASTTQTAAISPRRPVVAVIVTASEKTKEGSVKQTGQPSQPPLDKPSAVVAPRKNRSR